MKSTKKRVYLLTIAILLGIHPTTNYNATTLTERLWKQITGYVPAILGTALGTYITAKIMKSVMNAAPTQPTTAKKTITFKDYIGVPQAAITLVDSLKNPEKYKKMGVSMTHGILLTGDPGVGKTYLAQAIAGEVDCPFFEFSGPYFVQGHLGASIAAITGAFKTARDTAKKENKKLAIIFIDEFDALGNRTSEVSQYYTNMINAFLTEMDGFAKDQISVIVIAATNFPENIDPAFKRPGRFDYIIHIPYPDKKSRIKLLELAAKNKPMNPNMSFDNLAEATEGLSHADIKLLFDLAGNTALEHNNIERDYDSFVKAIWQIKEKDHMLKMASREERKKSIDQYAQKLLLPNNLTEDLLIQTTDMTIADIHEIFEKAYKFSQEKPENTLLEWLWIAIAAKKQQLKIRKNREAFELCKKIYGLSNLEEPDQKALLTIEPDYIFSAFNVSYPNNPEIEFRENNNQDIKPQPSINILGENQ
jgi:ATP-dependent Zn protease